MARARKLCTCNSCSKLTQTQSVALGEVQNEVTKTRTPPSRRAYFTAQNTTKSLQELTTQDDEEFSFIDRSVPPPQRVEDETHSSLHQLTQEEEEEDVPSVPAKRPLIEVLRETLTTFDRQFYTSSSVEDQYQYGSDEDTLLLDQIEQADMQLLLLPSEHEELKGSDTELDNASEDTELVPTSSSSPSSADSEATQEVETELNDGYLTDIVRTSSEEEEKEEDGNATELVPTDDEQQPVADIVVTVVEPEPIIAERPILKPLVAKPPPPKPRSKSAVVEVITPRAQVVEAVVPPPIVDVIAPIPAVVLAPPPIAAVVEVNELKRIEDDLVNSFPANANLSVRDIVQHVLTMMFHGPVPQHQQAGPISIDVPPPMLVQEEYVPPADLPSTSSPPPPPLPPPEQVVSHKWRNNRLVLQADSFDESAFISDDAPQQVDLSRYIHIASTSKNQQTFTMRRWNRHHTSKKYPLHALSVRRRRRY